MINFGKIFNDVKNYFSPPKKDTRPPARPAEAQKSHTSSLLIVKKEFKSWEDIKSYKDIDAMRMGRTPREVIELLAKLKKNRPCGDIELLTMHTHMDQDEIEEFEQAKIKIKHDCVISVSQDKYYRPACIHGVINTLPCTDCLRESFIPTDPNYVHEDDHGA